MNVIYEGIVQEVLHVGAAMVLEEKCAKAVVRVAAERGVLLEYVREERSAYPPIGRKAMFLQLWLRPRFFIRKVAERVVSGERYCALRMDLPRLIVPVSSVWRTHTRYTEYERTQADYWKLEFGWLTLDEAKKLYTRPRKYNSALVSPFSNQSILIE